MIGLEEQSALIKELNDAEAFTYEEFTSAAGIRGNFKIFLPEALKRNMQLMHRFTGHMALQLINVDAIAAVGGAVEIAEEISSETDLPFIKIEKNQKGFFQTADVSSNEIIAKKPKIGFIEDVTSTRDTTERAIDNVHIRSLIDKVVVGWRRGVSAPSNMSTAEVMSYNRQFNFRSLYEVPTSLPLVSVIERFIPLWLPTEAMIFTRLPELSREKV